MSEKEEYPETYSERKRSRSEGETSDLADCNEQELEKAEFSRSAEVFAAREESPLPQETRESKGASERAEGTSDAKPPVRRHSSEDLPHVGARERAVTSPKESEQASPQIAWGAEERQEPPRKRRNPNGTMLSVWVMTVTLMAAVVILVFVLLSGGGLVADGQTGSEPAGESDGQDASQKVVYIRQVEDDSGILTMPELYERCADTVVSILTRGAGGTGIGSGFIVSANGYIGTANHVVEGMDELVVVLADGSQYEAVLVAGDSMTDLALLKIDGRNLPTVQVGRSSELLVGERVIAIGTPASLDYAGSICSGEISYLGRTVRIYDDSTGALEKKMTLIQTDVPVNPGNSGCPLFDEYGRVVGVVTMKLGSNYAGIGFAIPADGAWAIFRAMAEGRELTDGLLAEVSVAAPKLGILGEAATVDGILGVRIRGFSHEGVPSAAALRVGDLILRIGDTSVRALSDVSAAINDYNPEDVVAVTVYRSGQTLTFDVVLGK